MYILTNKNNVIIHIGKTLEEKEDRYKIDNNIVFKEYKTQDIDGNIEINKINMYEVEEIPKGIQEHKYCYTEEKGFYKNENYIQYYSNEERISALEDMVNMLLLGGNE